MTRTRRLWVQLGAMAFKDIRDFIELLEDRGELKRVTAPDVVVPLSRLEGRYMPRMKRILEAAREVVAFS